jgi:glycosyltransferase involved in cell wall biosynthesis
VRAHLYTVSWNEADMLGFFFRHYDAWVDRYVFYDDGSTDETLAMLSAHPRVEVRRLERTHPNSFVASAAAMRNQAWKESRGAADWIVIVDVDEHVCVPGTPMRDYLEQCRRRRVSLLHGMGFQMVSEDFPAPHELLCETRTVGAPYGLESKLSIFDPGAVDETNFGPGRHRARPRGRVRLPERDHMLLLHYKYIGFERLYQRHRFLKAGLRKDDLQRAWATQYDWSRERLRQDWELFARAAVDVAAVGFSAWRCHRNRRWWRPAWKIKRRLGLVSRWDLRLPRSPASWEP